MRSINVDSTIKKDVFVDAKQAAALLGVKLQTLYAYTSRGLIESLPGERGRGRRYAREELERLKARHDARAGHGPVAASALRWGEPVLDSALTGIDERGPIYRGRRAVELAGEGASFEQVAELLWTGVLPDEAPRWPASSFELTRLAALLPEDAPPMLVMSLMLPALAAGDLGRFAAPREAELARARAAIASLCLTLAPAQAAKGVKKAKPAKVSAKALPPSIAQRLAAQLELGGNDKVRAAIDAALVLVADHELNVSSFSARVAASSGADLYACLSAAMASVSGPLHGGASDRIEALVAEAGKVDRAVSVVADRARRGEVIPGFGHPLYPAGDPRAAALLAIVERLGGRSARLATLLAIAKAMRQTGRGEPTIDYALVALGYATGARPGWASGLFALGRAAGWVAQALEQREAGHLLRPRARYVGPLPSEG